MDSAVLLLFAAIIVVGLTLLIVIALAKRPSGRLDTAKYQERWMAITASVGEDTPSMQLAILNADKLLDQALRERGVAGNNLGERLKKNGNLFRDLNGTWNAHKLRNRIAHEHDVALNARTTQAALQAFKTALKDLGAL